MNVNFEQTGNVTGVITIALGEADYQGEVTKTLKELGRRRPVQGFRPGHVPMNMLKRMYGEQALVEAVNEKVSEALYNYINENKLEVLGEPLMSADTKVDFNTEKDFTFKFDLGLSPKVDVDLAGVTVPFYTIEVSDDMVEKQVEAQRKRYGKQVPGEEVTAEALVKGALVELNEDGSVKEDGVKVENSIQGVQFMKSDDEKAKFLGKKVGEEVVYNPFAASNGNVAELASLLSIDKEAAAEMKSNFKLTISEIIVVALAELGQEFYDGVFGKDAVKTEEEYKAKLKEQIQSSLVGDSNYRFTIDAEEALKTKVGEIELPDAFLKRFFTLKSKDKDAAKIEEEYPSMVPSLQWQLIKDKVAAKAEVKVSEDDLKNLAKFVASQQFAQYGMTSVPEDALENYAKSILDNQEYRRELAQRAIDDKVFAYIKENVSLEEKTVSVEAFNDLFKKAE